MGQGDRRRWGFTMVPWAQGHHFTPAAGSLVSSCYGLSPISHMDPLSSAHLLGSSRFRTRGSPGDSKSGVRIAVALLVREIQHSYEYRRNEEADSDYFLGVGVGAVHECVQKIMAPYDHACRRESLVGGNTGPL
jgi:hypothetical protein